MSDGLRYLAAILENGAATSLRDVNEDLFVGDERNVYVMVRDHYRRYRTLPTIETVNAEMQMALPSRRIDTPQYHLDKMRDRHFYNAVRPRFGDLRNAIKDEGPTEVREIIEELHALAKNDPALATDIHDASDVYNEVIQRYLEDRPYQDDGVLGIPTGWSWLDERTGGWQRGDIITIAARPELGKTWLLLHMLYSAWVANRSVMFFTTEMPPHQVGTRLIGYQTGVNPRLLRTLQLSQWGERRLFQALETVQNDGALKLVSAAGKSTQWVEDLIHEYQPDLVCIDGCYLLQPSSGRKDAGRFEKIGNVFDDLNTMKLRTNKPILVTTQMNRQAGEKGKSGSLETLGYSDAIGTHSSIILQIKPWPSWGQCTIPGFNFSAARVIQPLKGREGPLPAFPIFYEPPRKFSRIRPPRQFGDEYRPGATIDRNEIREGTREDREQRTNWMIDGEQNG